MDTLLVRLQRAVAGRYAVEHELGRGGMAMVFLGHDLRLERRVAIKVLEHGDTLFAAVERFLAEIRIAAQLQHPNILPVFESGEGENLVYYVMPYVVGGSLQERLEREGPLPIGDAVRIAREVAEALDHAHRAGIVHRDIKPGNIMLADGVAVVADFGIARAVEASGGRLTDTGLALGTPSYMSPEQATASTHVDGRADLYALGCVLYEMLAGAPPFSGPTGQAVMARHASDQVPPLRTIRDVPPALEAAVLKALAKLPADRWPTGRAMADALSSTVTTSPVALQASPPHRMVRWVAAAAVLLFVGAALVWKVAASGGDGRRSAASRADSLPSIVVMPFILLGDSAQAHIAGGFKDAVVTALVRAGGGGMHIRDQGDSILYVFRSQDPVAYGRKHRADNVLVGSVEVSGDLLRVNARLVRVADGYIQWSDQSDGEISNVFAMQDKITRKIIDFLQVQLTPAGRSVLERGVGTRDQAAYTHYTMGRSLFLREDAASLRRAEDQFRQAAARDSMYAAPLVGLLDAEYLLGNVEPGGPHVPRPELRKLIQRVLALDPTNGDVHAFLAGERIDACDFDGADREWREGIRLNPGSAQLRRNYAEFLVDLGRFQDAVEAGRRAEAIDPSSPWVVAMLGWAYSLTGQHDSALSVTQRVLVLDSTRWISRAVYGAALTSAGRVNEGIAHLEAARRLGGETHSQTTALLGWAYARAGRRQDAERIVRLLGERVERGEATRWQVASVYAGLGEREKALEWLARPPQPADLRQEYGYWLPMLDPLRSDARFETLAKRRWCGPAA